MINDARHVHLTLALLVCCVTLISQPAFADCRPPNYRQGFVWEDTPSNIMLNISIRMTDLAPSRLICLASALRNRYSGRSRIHVLIFTRYAAAKNFTTPFVGDSPFPQKNWSLDNHAFYIFDSQTEEEYVVLTPDAVHPGLETKILLPATAIPQCTLELAGRCVLATTHIGTHVQYPWKALKANVMGTVELQGRIGRNGVVDYVKAVSVEASLTDGRTLLVDAAVQNLKAWRFETAMHEDFFRVIYSYVIDHAAGPTTTKVSLNAQGTLEIKAYSLR